MAACHRPVPTWFTISRAQYPPLISLNLFFGQRNRKSRRPVLFFCFYREIRERLRRRRRRNRRAPHNFAAIESIGNCNFRRVETVTSLRPISVFPRKKKHEPKRRRNPPRTPLRRTNNKIRRKRHQFGTFTARGKTPFSNSINFNRILLFRKRVTSILFHGP